MKDIFDIASLCPGNILSSSSVAAVLAILAITLLFLSLDESGLPPGPTGMPFLGYWPFLNSKTCHLQLEKLKKKYGDVFSFTVTGTLYINLGSAKALREAHVNNADFFTERPTSFTLAGLLFQEGIFSCHGESWKIHRKLFQQVMKTRNVTSVRGSSSASVYDPLDSVLDDLRTSGGRPVNLIDLLTKKCVTVLRMTLFGEIGIREEQIRAINELYVSVVASLTLLNALLVGNIARYVIFPFKSEYREGVKNLKKIEILLNGIIKEHKRTYNADHPRDVIDDYLKEKEERLKKGDPSARYLTDKALVSSLLQFVGDGVVAVASVISLSIKSLLDFPEEQDRIYEEILEVIGRDRQPTLEDKPRLVYLNAFLWESFRTSDFFPFFPGLECSSETMLYGYKIPKGAITLINMYNIHMDEEVYDEPFKFKPKRFISNGDSKGQPLPVTFGVGKRSCLGEGFVMTQMMLFIATIVQNFHLQLETKKSDSTFEQVVTGDIYITATPRK